MTMKAIDLDKITRERSAFTSFADLLNSHPTYRPTILIREAADLTLARAYDDAMRARGDKRRAYTGATAPMVGDRITFYALGDMRTGRIEKIGRKWLVTSYATKRALRAAARLSEWNEPGAAPIAAHRFHRKVALDGLESREPWDAPGRPAWRAPGGHGLALTWRRPVSRRRPPSTMRRRLGPD
jgi:hypothetical protein